MVDNKELEQLKKELATAQKKVKFEAEKANLQQQIRSLKTTKLRKFGGFLKRGAKISGRGIIKGLTKGGAAAAKVGQNIAKAQAAEKKRLTKAKKVKKIIIIKKKSPRRKTKVTKIIRRVQPRTPASISVADLIS